MPSPGPRPWIRVLTVLSTLAAVALLVVHLVLDTSAAEAPRWVLYVAMTTALAAASLAGYRGIRERQR
jgi:hypothetical protein